MRVLKALILRFEGYISDVVTFSYISVPWYGMSGGSIIVEPRFLPQRVWFFTISPLRWFVVFDKVGI